MRPLQRSNNDFNKKREKGLAAIEFIICLPVLLMLLALLIDVSRAFIQYTEINKALQNGARYAVMESYGTLNFGNIADKELIKNMVVYGTPIPSETTRKVIKYIDTEDVIITEPTLISKEVVISTYYTYVPIFSSLPFSDNSLSFTIGATSKMRSAP